MPNKGGMIALPNEKNELIPMRSVTGWRVCMDYRKLNAWTEKVHFLMPFKKGVVFFYGYSGYNQISISKEDQDKTTFT